MGRADSVPVGDGGEPLDRGSEQSPERLGLRLAKLRKLGRHVRHRAVVLAELLPTAGRGDARGCGIAISGQCLREGLRARGGGRRIDDRPVPQLQIRDLLAREFGHRLLAAGPGQEPQRATREIVVRVLKRAPPGIGDGEQLRRSAPASATVCPGCLHLDHAVAEQDIKVPPDRGRGEPEPAAERECGDRPVFEDQPGHARPGAALTDVNRARLTSASLDRGSRHPAAGIARRLRDRLPGDRCCLPHVFHNISVA